MSRGECRGIGIEGRGESGEESRGKKEESIPTYSGIMFGCESPLRSFVFNEGST